MSYTEAQLTNPNRPPNPEQPWMWDPKSGRWFLVATDTSDGVPDDLSGLLETDDDGRG